MSEKIAGVVKVIENQLANYAGFPIRIEFGHNHIIAGDIQRMKCDAFVGYHIYSFGGDHIGDIYITETTTLDFNYSELVLRY